MEPKAITGQDVTIRRLTKEEMISIYTTYSVRHFPADERKPVSSVERMIREGIYAGYGLYHKTGGELLSYAFFTILPERKIGLLDYFATMEDYRGQGAGSFFLQHIKVFLEHKGFLIESEDPDYARDEQDFSVRCKRLDFYKKNGAVLTGIKSKAFGVPYCLLYFPVLSETVPGTADLCSMFEHIYRRMVSTEQYETQIGIYPPASFIG